MANLTKIDVRIKTSDRNNAGTNGLVYLGICGREFRCDSKKNDFERGSNRTYTFGDDSNVQKADNNDPRKPQLSVEDADRFPVYIRFEQRTSSEWNLEQATVHLNDSSFQNWESFVHPEGLWLGRSSGAFLYLNRHGAKPIT